MLSSPINKVLKNAGILLSGNMGANIFGLLSLAVFTHSQGVVMLGYILQQVRYFFVNKI